MLYEQTHLFLADNPILCDAALPEITSAMEVNHTRIFGVSHCPPLSEQPTTSRPNRFLGYVPEEALVPSPAPAAISAEIFEYQKNRATEGPQAESRIRLGPYAFQLKRDLPTLQYAAENVQQQQQPEKRVSDQEKIGKLLTEIEVIKSQLNELANETKATDSNNKTLLLDA